MFLAAVQGDRTLGPTPENVDPACGLATRQKLHAPRVGIAVTLREVAVAGQRPKREEFGVAVVA